MRTDRQKQEEITERRSDSGSRLQPLREPPREERVAKSRPCYQERGSITEKIRRQWRENRVGDIYACMRRKYSEKSKEGGVLRSGDREERRKRAIYYHNEEKPAKKGENINMKNQYVSVAEEGKSPHRQLYK